MQDPGDSSLPDSLRKKRQRRRRWPGDELTDALRESISADQGVTIEPNPALDFRTLGFNVTVPIETTDSDIVALGNRLLAIAVESRFARETDWTWMIGISRSGELVSVLQTGDNRQVMCPVCGNVQDEILDTSCLSCLSDLAS